MPGSFLIRILFASILFIADPVSLFNSYHGNTIISAVEAKVSEGTVQLDSINPEQYLAKFSFSPQSRGTIAGSFSVVDKDEKKSYYDNKENHVLMICTFDDEAWTKYQEAIKSGSLCTDRMKLCTFTSKIIPKSDTNFAPGRDFTFHLIVNQKPTTHYMWAVMSDCVLEYYQAHPPTLKFAIIFQNGDTHLPADEIYMTEMHIVLIGVLCLFGLVYLKKMKDQYNHFHHIHLITLLLGSSWLMQLMGAVFELFHLWAYAKDGRGLRFRHGRIPADFISSIMQTTSELYISFVLLCLAMGWTLAHTFFSIQNSPAKSGVGQFNKKNMLGLMVLLTVLNTVLEVWARFYKDDFAQFHDLEHLPGYILISIRMLMGIFFFVKISALIKNQSSENSANENICLFLKKLRWQGTMYFLSFPLLFAVATFLPIYARHPFVSGGTLFLQCVALMGLMTMFLDESSLYFKVSTIKLAASTDSLGGGLSLSRRGTGNNPSISLGKIKTKIAID